MKVRNSELSSAEKRAALIRKLAMELFLTKPPKFIGYRLLFLGKNTNITLTIKAFFGTVVRKIKGRI
jgi:hypothetical protein